MKTETVEIFSTSDLSAFVDGTLEEDHHAALAEFIRENADAAEKVLRYRNQAEKIKRLFGVASSQI